MDRRKLHDIQTPKEEIVDDGRRAGTNWPNTTDKAWKEDRLVEEVLFHCLLCLRPLSACVTDSPTSLSICVVLLCCCVQYKNAPCPSCLLPTASSSISLPQEPRGSNYLPLTEFAKYLNQCCQTTPFYNHQPWTTKTLIVHETVALTAAFHLPHTTSTTRQILNALTASLRHAWRFISAKS